jgi:hypothetical protein
MFAMRKKNLFKKSFVLAAVLSMVLSLLSLPPAQARSSQGGQPLLILNPGGGFLADGVDGIRMHFNSDNSPSEGSDQVFFDADRQWCCGGAGPVLAVGNTAFGEAGAARNSNLASWDTVSITAQRGAFEEIAAGGGDTPTSSDKGNAGATITYEKTSVSGFVYRVIRKISYVYPNNFYDEDWTVDIPGGNTDVVKLYLGGDAAPGNSDAGIGSTALRGAGLRVVYEANPDSGQYISYAPRSLASNFTHYFVGSYSAPYTTIASGGNLDDSVDTSLHDAGIQIQWTFGSTAGSYTRNMRTTVGYNEDIGSEPEPDAPAEGAVETVAAETPTDPYVYVSSPVVSASGQEVAFFGVRLAQVTGVLVGGELVPFKVIGDSELRITSPSNLRSGTYALVLKYGTNATAEFPDALNIPRLRLVTTISGFGANSAVLTGQLSKGVRQALAKMGGKVSLVCVGSTQGSVVRAADRQLARERAMQVCDMASKSFPEVSKKIKIRPASDSTPRARNVKLVVSNY